MDAWLYMQIVWNIEVKCYVLYLSVNIFVYNNCNIDNLLFDSEEKYLEKKVQNKKW